MSTSTRRFQGTQRCLQCEYDLRGSAQVGRWPECGWEFHPSTIIIDCWSWGEWPRLWNIPFYAIVILSALSMMFIARVIIVRRVSVLFVVLGLFVLAKVLWNLRVFVTRVKAIAPNRLVLFRRSVATFVGGSRKISHRYHEINVPRIRRVPRGYWRVTFLSRFSLGDIVVAGDKRFIAALRAELKRRRKEAVISAAVPKGRN